MALNSNNLGVKEVGGLFAAVVEARINFSPSNFVLGFGAKQLNVFGDCLDKDLPIHRCYCGIIVGSRGRIKLRTFTSRRDKSTLSGFEVT